MTFNDIVTYFESMGVSDDTVLYNSGTLPYWVTDATPLPESYLGGSLPVEGIRTGAKRLTLLPVARQTFKEFKDIVGTSNTHNQLLEDLHLLSYSVTNVTPNNEDAPIIHFHLDKLTEGILRTWLIPMDQSIRVTVKPSVSSLLTKNKSVDLEVPEMFFRALDYKQQAWYLSKLLIADAFILEDGTRGFNEEALIGSDDTKAWTDMPKSPPQDNIGITDITPPVITPNTDIPVTEIPPTTVPIEDSTEQPSTQPDAPKDIEVVDIAPSLPSPATQPEAEVIPLTPLTPAVPTVKEEEAVTQPPVVTSPGETLEPPVTIPDQGSNSQDSDSNTESTTDMPEGSTTTDTPSPTPNHQEEPVRPSGESVGASNEGSDQPVSNQDGQTDNSVVQDLPKEPITEVSESVSTEHQDNMDDQATDSNQVTGTVPHPVDEDPQRPGESSDTDGTIQGDTRPQEPPATITVPGPSETVESSPNLGVLENATTEMPLELPGFESPDPDEPKLPS